MYARSTSFHGMPASIDAGITFVESEVAPMFNRMEGCRGLSMLVDRETGECIVTSSWETEDAMHASEGQVLPIRARGREIFGGSIQVDEWEVAVMHRTHHGECCRVSWLQGDLAALTDSFREGILPELEETPGFCSASLLVDPEGGVGCATTVWESRQAMEASRSSADEMRMRAATDSDGQIVRVQEFDLAYAHLHVPEMA